MLIRFTLNRTPLPRPEKGLATDALVAVARSVEDTPFTIYIYIYTPFIYIYTLRMQIYAHIVTSTIGIT